jgi:hypothetical protein
MYLGEISEAVSEIRIEDPTRYEEAVTRCRLLLMANCYER